MRAIVTGGAGFIGSALTRHLVSNLGWSVLVLDKLTYAGHLSSLALVADAANFAFRKIDIRQREALTEAFNSHQPDIVFHLAAESHVDRSITHAADFIETNVIGTFNILEATRGYWSGLASTQADRFRILHVSTDEVFGSLGSEGLFREESPYDPRSPYSASKAASDHLARAWRHTYGLPVLISNCSNNYGPYQLPEKLIPTIILKALHGENIPVYGNGSNIRDWLYVDDHVEALCLMAQNGAPGRTYNVGGRSERTNLQVASAVCELLDRFAGKSASHRDLIAFVADRPGHDQRYAIDSSRLENELGWRPRESFETGIARTVRWYLDNSDWWAPLRRTGVGVARQGLLNPSVELNS